MSEELRKQLEGMIQRWQENEKHLATKEDVDNLIYDLKEVRLRLRYWMIGIFLGNTALAVVLKLVLNHYWPQ